MKMARSQYIMGHQVDLGIGHAPPEMTTLCNVSCYIYTNHLDLP